MKILTDKTMSFGNIHYFCAYIGSEPLTCYVLRGSNGDMLIDTGLPFVYRELLRYLGDFDIRYIFLTHAHTDHDSNAERFRRELGAEILLGERDRELIGHFRRQPVKVTAQRYRLRNMGQNLMGGMKLFNTRPYSPDILVNSSSTGLMKELGFEGRTVLLPGHTLGSAGILSEGVLYCGDAFTAIWEKPDITPHAASPRAMVLSLEKILELSPEWLATGHGLPVSMRDAKPVIRRYVFTNSRLK